MAKQRFYIEGMTCSGCERTLEHAVLRLEGMHEVRANRQKGQLDTDFSLPCTQEQVIQAVRKRLWVSWSAFKPKDSTPPKPGAICFFATL